MVGPFADTSVHVTGTWKRADLFAIWFEQGEKNISCCEVDNELIEGMRCEGRHRRVCFALLCSAHHRRRRRKENAKRSEICATRRASGLRTPDFQLSCRGQANSRCQSLGHDLDCATKMQREPSQLRWWWWVVGWRGWRGWVKGR